MAYTMTNGVNTKVVSSDAQKDELIAHGWTVASGSASETSYDVHDYTNPTPRTFKGVGLNGQKAGSLAAVAIAATEGADQPTYEYLMKLAREHGEETPAAAYSTGFKVVSALPGSSQSATTVYVLTAYDSTNSKQPGLYVYANSAWAAYDPQ